MCTERESYGCEGRISKYPKVGNLNLFQDLQTEGGVGQNDVGTVRKGTVLASEQRNLLISDFKSFPMGLKASWRKSSFQNIQKC